jgi:hypothetical protein
MRREWISAGKNAVCCGSDQGGVDGYFPEGITSTSESGSIMTR